MRPIISAFWTCLLLAGAFIGFIVFEGLGKLINETFILGGGFLIIALISVTVYQSVRIYDSASQMAEGMAKDILLYSRELFSELYRSSPVPYILIDAKGSIDSTNFAAVRLFHIKEGEMDGTNMFDYLESEDPNRVGLISEKFKQGLFVNEEEVMIRRLDGTERWVLLSLFSFRDSRNARKGLLTLVDITKQKEIDKAKTEFVSLASHQLRTPISAMKWNVELLHTAGPTSFTPLQEEYLIKIARGLVRMENLVDDFLNVSKLELGTLTANLTDIELASFINDLLEEHQKRSESKQVALEVEIGGAPSMIRSDGHLLTMIVGNLISNAIKYTPEGGTVRLRCDEDGEHIVITVSDTGIGIPEDDKDQIFSKVFRAANARDSATEGTGLGLYIVREAAKVLGGTVTFVSEENRGTTFTVVLPH